MPTNLVVLAVALVCATAIGLWLRRYNGHFRGAAKAEVPIDPVSAEGDIRPTLVGSSPTAGAGRLVLTSADLASDLGDRATLVQFSSAFCAPCRVTRRVLADVAELVPGVVHVELDAEHNLDLVRRLGVMRTPTTFIVDAEGAVVTRASGAPSKPGVVAALGRVIS